MIYPFIVKAFKIFAVYCQNGTIYLGCIAQNCIIRVALIPFSRIKNRQHIMSQLS